MLTERKKTSFISQCHSQESENQDIEHIIIDGLSKDNTLEVVKNSKHNGPVFSEKDKGIYNAMNKGIKVAKGEFLLFLNL